MISILIKHFIYEHALEVFFHTVQKNIISWKAQQIILSNIKKTENSVDGTITYSTYYEGRLITYKVTRELIHDIGLIHGVILDDIIYESLQYEAMVSVMDMDDFNKFIKND
jgi:hypothetical protein